MKIEHGLIIITLKNSFSIQLLEGNTLNKNTRRSFNKSKQQCKHDNS